MINKDLNDKERKRLWEGKCADCEGKLIEGPHGGCSINWQCSKCNNKFNVCIHQGTFAERI